MGGGRNWVYSFNDKCNDRTFSNNVCCKMIAQNAPLRGEWSVWPFEAVHISITRTRWCYYAM